jgi:hypothetical protein
MFKRIGTIIKGYFMKAKEYVTSLVASVSPPKTIPDMTEEEKAALLAGCKQRRLQILRNIGIGVVATIAIVFFPITTMILLLAATLGLILIIADILEQASDYLLTPKATV